MVVCALSIQYVFHGIMHFHMSVLGIILALPAAFVGIRALAEADYNPQSGLGMLKIMRIS